MSPNTQQIVYMLDMLPKKEQDFAYEMLKKIILAWDPDFTNLTSDEAKQLEIGRNQLSNDEFYRENEIDWDNLDKIDLD